MKSLLRFLWAYFKANLLFNLLGLYFLFSIVLKMSTGLDYGIPCLHRLVTGQNCWGCGMTRAFIELVQLNFSEAYAYNPLIFVVAPALIWAAGIDLWLFYKKYRQTTPQ